MSDDESLSFRHHGISGRFSHSPPRCRDWSYTETWRGLTCRFTRTAFREESTSLIWTTRHRWRSRAESQSSIIFSFTERRACVSINSEKCLWYLMTFQWTTTSTRYGRRISSVLLKSWIWRKWTGEETAESEFPSSSQTIERDLLAFKKWADDDEYSGAWLQTSCRSSLWCRHRVDDRIRDSYFH